MSAATAAEQRLTWKYAHTPGKTDLAVTYCAQEDTSVIYTCGSDATVRAFKWQYGETKEKSFPRKFQITYPHREDILAISASNIVPKLVTGDKEGYLRLFHRKEDAAELECVLTRTSGAIWCCAFSCSGIYVFVAGEEPGVVRVIDIADRTVSIASENAPMQAIRELVVDPLGDYFLSIGERGAVGLWSLNQNACVSTIYNHAISADWRFDGSLLVISTNTKELVFLERESWKVKRSFSDVATSVKITCLSWRSQTDDILCGCENGKIFLMRYAKDIQVVAYWGGDEHPIESIVWHPKWNGFVAVDAAGQLTRVEQVPVRKVIHDSTENGKVSHDSRTSGELNPNDPMDNEDAIAAENQEEENDILLEDEISLNSSTSMEEQAEETMLPKDYFPSKCSPRHFMISSTPFDGSHSIFCWNRTGKLISRDVESHYTIEIEFSDTSMKPLRFRDHYGFSLGCLNSVAVILAAKKRELEEDSRNIIFYRNLSSSWTFDSHWTISLDDSETPLLVALGSHWAAVFTSKARLRIFSSTGIQTDLLKLEQRVLTILGSESQLCIVYDDTGLDEKCEFECLQISSFGLVDSRSSRMSLPCKPSFLQWIGFRETASAFEELLAFSKAQELYMFLPYHGNSWTIVAENTSSSCTFWPCYCYHESLFGIACSKNGQETPKAFASPPLTCLSLKLPLLPFTESSLPLEQQYLWELLTLCKFKECTSLSGNNKLGEKRKKLDKILIRLFEDSCVTNHVARAFDFASRLYSYKAYKIACQVANHHKLGALAQKVESMMDQCPEIQETKSCLVDDSAESPTIQQHNNNENIPVRANQSTEAIQVVQGDLAIQDKTQGIGASTLVTPSRIQERKRKLQEMANCLDT